MLAAAVPAANPGASKKAINNKGLRMLFRGMENLAMRGWGGRDALRIAI
ncbi:hypothetical protein [Stenotrophomonas nitritireducens]